MQIVDMRISLLENHHKIYNDIIDNYLPNKYLKLMIETYLNISTYEEFSTLNTNKKEYFNINLLILLILIILIILLIKLIIINKFK